MKNYYRILNVDSDASDEEIKRNYRVLAKRYHPDHNPGDATADKRFRDVNEAYDVLTDADKRAEYDSKIRQEELLRIQQERQDRTTYVVNDANLAQQLQSTYNQGYQDGYVAGYTSIAVTGKKDVSDLNGKIKLLTQQNAELKSDIAKLKQDRSDLEQELFDRDRRLAEKTEQIGDLSSRLQWLKNATNMDTTQTVDPLRRHSIKTRTTVELLKREIEQYVQNSETISTNITTLAQQERRKQIREELIKTDKRIAELVKELEHIKSIEDQKRKVSDSDAMLRSMEERADRKLAKPTLYGVLGVLIWATTNEIDAAYERLAKRYSSARDSESAAQMQKVKDAYAVLVNPKRRTEYNESIGYSPEAIAIERGLIEENMRIQAEYRDKLAAKAFWARFDDLSSIALSGDADAQNALGEIYYNGVNIECDYNHAAYWFREAFEQNHPAAIYNLGVCYFYGRGVGKNASIARAVFRQAENLGYVPKGNSPRADDL